MSYKHAFCLCYRCGRTIRRADNVDGDVNTSTHDLGEINKLAGKCLILKSTTNVLVNVEPEYVQSMLWLRCTCADSAVNATLLHSILNEKRSKVQLECELISVKDD